MFARSVGAAGGTALLGEAVLPLTALLTSGSAPVTAAVVAAANVGDTADNMDHAAGKACIRNDSSKPPGPLLTGTARRPSSVCF